MKDLFALSIPLGCRYVDKFFQKPEYDHLVTFAQNKTTPVYNWLYYKEGFSRDLVWDLLEDFKATAGATVLDPFCGTGTTLLACNEVGLNSIGFDVLPLGVFASKTKLQRDYDMNKLRDAISWLMSEKFGETSSRMVDVRFIDMRKAFSRYARNDLMFFRDRIMRVEDESIRNFLLLGLVSIVTEASNTKKDGGVIRIVSKRHLPPVRELLKRRLKRMFKDLDDVKRTDASADVYLGDARSLTLEDNSVDYCITSPPYLNYVDYTKLYALELSMLLKNSEELSNLRKKTMRSHVGAEYHKTENVRSEDFERMMRVLEERSPGDLPLMVRGYFEDSFLYMSELYRVMKNGGTAALVVGNACLPDVTVDVDLILGEIGEQIGFTLEKIVVANVRWCEVGSIRKERPVRESVVVLKK